MRRSAAGFVLACAALAAHADGGARPTVAQIEAARAGVPYLVVETAPPRLRLMLGGAVLRDYEVLSVEAGRPTVAFVDRSRRAADADRLPRVAAVEPRCTPPRVEITAPRPGDEVPEPSIPPQPDEACPCPRRFSIRFDTGFVLDVVPAMDGADAGGAGRGPAPRLRDRWDAVADPAPRLRLVLAEDDAGALYRSLPQGAGLIVRPQPRSEP